MLLLFSSSITIEVREGIDPKVISGWKQELLKNAHRAFTIGNEDRQLKQELRASTEKENELAVKVGVLLVENDWLKKSKEVLGYSDFSFCCLFARL